MLSDEEQRLHSELSAIEDEVARAAVAIIASRGLRSVCRDGACRGSASSRHASLPETHELRKQHSPFLLKRTNRMGLLSDGQTAEQESSRGRDERTAHSYDDISAATNATTARLS
jgi:hypothetical protein